MLATLCFALGADRSLARILTQQHPLQPANVSENSTLLANATRSVADGGAWDPTPLPWEGCTIVLAEHDDAAGGARVFEVAKQHRTDCAVKLYAKGPTGCEAHRHHPYFEASRCEALPNRGREFHTFLTHVVRHYDALPERLIFVPLPLTKHPDREAQLSNQLALERPFGEWVNFDALSTSLTARATLLDTRRATALLASPNTSTSSSPRPSSSFSCVAARHAVPDFLRNGIHTAFLSVDAHNPHDGRTVRTLGDGNDCYGTGGAGCAGFFLHEHEGRVLQRASPCPLGEWARAHLGEAAHGDLCHAMLCLYGAFSADRGAIQHRSRDNYSALLAQFDALEVEVDSSSKASEIGHYMERMTHLVFGGSTVGGGGRACPEPTTAQRTAGHALGGGTSLIERIGRAVVPTPTCADVPTTLETRLAASLGKSQ